MNKSLLFTIVIAVILGVSLLSFLPNDGAFIFIKALLIIIISVGAYLYLFKIQTEDILDNIADEDVAETEFAEEDQSDNSEDIPMPTEEVSVDDYYERFLDTLLPVIRQTTVSKNVVLLMVNFFKKQFYIRKFDGVAAQAIEKELFSWNEGLPARILKEKKSILENDLPPIKSLVPYMPEILTTKSFAGVPVYYQENVLGMLCADSDVQGSFSQEDLELLEQYSSIISLQMAHSNKLYEYETENQTTRLLYDFSRKMIDIHSVSDLWETLSESLLKIFKADSVIIAEKEANNCGKLTFIKEKNTHLETGQTFPCDEGLLGWVLRKNEAIIIEDFTAKENYIPRLSLDEEPITEFKSLLAVPIQMNNDAQMVIAVQSKRSSQFDAQHRKILESLSWQISGFLRNVWTVRNLQKHNTIDTNTKLGNQRALLQMLEKEVLRAKNGNHIFSLLLWKINAGTRTLDEKTIQKLQKEVLKYAKQEFDGINTLFYLEDNLFAVLYPEKVLRSMAESFQSSYRKIDQHKPWADGLIEKVYFNSGAVEFPQMGETAEQLLTNAHKALEKAVKRGPKVMEIYSTALDD